MFPHPRARVGERVRLFFATDIHGSEQCFRKWLNAASAYEADALIMGGDISGKALVPLVAQPDGGFRGELFGQVVEARDEHELAALRNRIRTIGRYDLVVSPEEKEELETDPERIHAEFRRAMYESLARWVKLADDRLGEAGIPCFVMLGNDDVPELADILRNSKVLHYSEDLVCELPGGWEMVSFGYSTPTPWATARELTESEIAVRLEALVDQLQRPRRAIFNFHCPPKNCHLDQAPLLDDKLRPVVGFGGVATQAVGSQAVRDAIERVQPVLGLHGHVHECTAAVQLGDTLCINPGSEYSKGILRGAIIDLEQGTGVHRWQLTQG